MVPTKALMVGCIILMPCNPSQLIKHIAAARSGYT